MTEEKLLSRKEILAIDDAVYEYIDMPEWGGTIRVKSLSGTERRAYERSLIVIGDGKDVEVNWDAYDTSQPRLVSMSIVDKFGKPEFSIKDITKLGQKSSANLQRVFEVCQRISALDKKSIQETAENLAKTPSEDLISS